MRLIDADTLQEHFEKVKKESERIIDIAQIIGVQAVIDSQPTAYDVDKVVERLEVNSTFVQTDDEDIVDDEAVVMLDDAIEIVKSGGKNEVN